MTTFETPRLFDWHATTRGRLMAGGLMAFLAIRFKDLVERFRPRDGRRPGPNVEVLATPEEFVERLEELTRQSLRLCFFDSSNVTRCLVEAPSFLSSRCAPRLSYRQISAIGGEEEYEDLVCLIRRSGEAEKGTYFCVDEDPLLFASLSFCLVEREDGCYVFLIHGATSREPAHVVLVREEVFGKFMLQEYESLWERLAEKGPPLFQNGCLDASEYRRDADGNRQRTRETDSA